MASLDPLRRPSGGFAMVAMDQRESLRTIIAERSGMAFDAVPDDALVRFKVAVARVLSPAASAFLIDPEFGLDPILSDGAIAPGCAIIVAADRLTQEPGGPVTDTDLDRELDVEAMAARGVAALKLLVLWRDDERREERVAMTAEFVEMCRRAAVISLVEGVARPAGAGTFDREAAIVEAAGELGATGPDLYKGEVPYRGKAPAPEITAIARELTGALDCPWVVLSQGVDAADFPAAVEAACAGGASGFLAGRAIWTDAIVALEDRELEGRLRDRSLTRLAQLARIVDGARPAVPVSSVVPSHGGRR